MVLYLLTANLQIMFTLFDLHIFHEIYKKRRNHRVINYNTMNLFKMLYIHILDGQNQVYMLRYVKENIYDFVDEDSCYS